MVKKNLHQLKPGMIFKLIDNMKYYVDVYGKKGTIPKKLDKSFYLEEWHAVIPGPYIKTTLYTILFKQIKINNGKDISILKDGEFSLEMMPKDVYDEEPPTEILLIEGKELRIIIDDIGLRAKLVDKK